MIEFGIGGPKFWLLLILTLALTGLTGCGASVLSKPTPSPNFELTSVVGTLEALREKLNQVVPTLTAIAAQPKDVIELIASPTARPTNTAAPLPVTASPRPETPQATDLQQAQTQPSQATPTVPSPDMPQTQETRTVIPSPGLPVSPMPDAQSIIMLDDFSTKSGWFQGETEQFKAGYRDGGYGITVKVVEKPIWSVRNKDVADVRIETDVTHLAGAEDGYFGLVCRQKGAGNYYSLTVSPNGAVEIVKVKDYQAQSLKQMAFAPWQFVAQAIHLRADCVGNTLTLFVNGEPVITATDDEFLNGRVGLIAGDRSKSGTDVIFDNFLVLSP